MTMTTWRFLMAIRNAALSAASAAMSVNVKRKKRKTPKVKMTKSQRKRIPASSMR